MWRKLSEKEAPPVECPGRGEVGKRLETKIKSGGIKEKNNKS